MRARIHFGIDTETYAKYGKNANQNPNAAFLVRVVAVSVSEIAKQSVVFFHCPLLMR